MRRQRSLMVLAAACAGVVASAVVVPNMARAAAVTWDGAAGGVWSDDANWAPDGPVAGNDAKFGAAAASNTAGAVTNIVSGNTTVLSLGYNQYATSGGLNAHTTQINDGVTLTLNGSTGANGATLYVGNGIDNSNPAANNLTFTNFTDQAGAVTGGTLRIDNPLADIHVRQTGNATGNRMATLNLYGLSNFNATMRDLNVAVGDPVDAALNRAQGTMFLAKNNTISANSINVGVNLNNGTTANPTGRLFFGNTNVINTNSITVGGMQTPSNSAGFNPATTSGSLTVRGLGGGVGRADLSIGAQLPGVTAGTSTNNNVVDFNGGSGFGSGTVDMRLNNVVIGRAGFTANAGGTVRNAVGTLTFGAGTIDANTVTLGDDNATANPAQGTGTLNVNNAAKLVVNQNLTLGRKANGGVVSGTLSINGATAGTRVNGPILDGGGASTISVNGGGTLQARVFGTAASRIDALNVTNSALVLDLSGGVPVAGAWGYVSALNPSGTNPLALVTAPGTLSNGQTVQGINYSTLGGAGFASFTLPKAPARTVAHLVNNANSIDVVIDSVDSPRWNGTAGGLSGDDWDINTSNNWQLIGAGTATTYQEDLATYSTTDSVTFDDNAANTNVDVITTVAPSFIAVNNPTKNYAFAGIGKITGNTGILKTGAGTLTIGNTGGNDFTGTVDVQGGTLATSASNVLPDTASVALAAGTTLVLADFSDTVDSVAINAGSVSVNNGTLTAGNLTLGSGSLAITGTGSVNANVLSYSGGTFAIGAGSVTASTLNLSNGVTLSPASGSITATTINIDNATIAAGNVTPAAINVNGNGAIDATVSGLGTLRKSGTTGTLTISGNNAYTGVTTLVDGIIRVTHGNALGATSGETQLENGGTEGAGYLELSGGIAVPENFTMHGRRGFTPANGGTGFMNYNPSIVNASGDNTITGDITLFTGGTHYAIRSDAGKLTITGDIINPITGDPLQTRFMHLRGAAAGEISGAILTTGGDTTDIVKLDTGTWTLSGNNGAVRRMTVQAGKLVLAAPLHRATLVDVQGTSTVEVAPGGGSNRVVRADTVTIASGAKLDLSDNKLLTSTPVGTFNGTSYSGIQGEVQRAYDFGAWDLPGLTTSQENAGQNAGPLSGTTTIGVATAEQVLFVGPTETTVVFGQTVTGATTIAMYTYAGDVNFDGLVDGADYGTLDNWIQFPGTDGYANGDVNYDGVIDGADYGVLDNSIQLQGDPFPGVFSASGSGAASLAGVTAVPEPSACGFAILAGAAMLGRRRRPRGAVIS